MAKQYQIIQSRGGTALSKSPLSQDACEAWFDAHPFHVEVSRESVKQPKGRELVKVFVSERAQ